MKKIKVCIIGCGMIANNAHIPAYKAYSDVYEITAVCDAIKISAENTSQKHSIPNYYTNVEKMLEEQKPDLVSICAPNMLHKQYVMLALQYKANVLCEKPLALTLGEAREMFHFAEKQERFLMACQSLRFLPERLATYNMIQNGEIGDVYYAEMSRIRRRGIPTWGKFHIKEYSGGGSFLDIGVHGLDSSIWLMGNPRPISVRAFMSQRHLDEIGTAESSGALKGNVSTAGFKKEDMDVESFSSGNISFENGAVLNFKACWSSNLREENNIILSGNNCGIDLENKKIYTGADKTQDFIYEPNGFLNEPFYGHFCLVKNMADAINKNDELFVKPEETLNVSAIIEAAYKSVETNREVKIKELYKFETK